MSIYDCPECGNGKLKREDFGWRCNGLADPGHDNLPLEACEYWVEHLTTNKTDLIRVNDHSMQRSTVDGEAKL